MAKRVKSTVDYDHPVVVHRLMDGTVLDSICLLYTSDAADD